MINARPTSLYIVDDSAPIRARLHEMFERAEDVRVVGEAANAPQAIVDILSLQPDAVVLDLDLNGTSGMNVLRAVVPQMPEVNFVVLTNHCEPQYRRACQRAGARHFLDKSTEFDLVRTAISREPLQ